MDGNLAQSCWYARCPDYGRARSTSIVKARLETKNDESRFGLTRAPFFKRRGSLERGQSLARRRAAQNGKETNQQVTLLLAELLNDPYWQWLALAALALIYGSAVMATVIVTLIKSARNLNPAARRRG